MVISKESGEGAENWLNKLKDIISSLPGRKLDEAAQDTFAEDMSILTTNPETGPIPNFLYSQGRVLEESDIRELDEEVILAPLNIHREIPETEEPIDIVLKKLRAKIQGDLITIFPRIEAATSVEKETLWETTYTFNHPENRTDDNRKIRILIRISRKNLNRIVYGLGVIEEPDLDRK